MLVQVNLGGTDSACCLSQTESGKADVKTAKEGDDEPVKGGHQPTFKATDIRGQQPSDRALRVAELERSLSNLKNNNLGRTKARRKSIMYSLSILCK